MFKSPTQPRCLWCSKPIAKHTVTTLVLDEPKPHHKSNEYYGYAYGEARSKADCQRMTNLEVVSLRYSNDGTVFHFKTWDGESYRDEFFCTNRHAEAFGYAAARHGLRLKKK